MNKYLIGLIILAATGCVESADTIQQHEKQQDVVISSPESEPNDTDVLDLKSISFESVLNPEKVRLAGYGFAKAERDALVEVNRRAIEILKGKSSDQTKRLRDIYYAAISVDCGKNISNCLGISYFKRAHNSAEVLRLLGETESRVEKAYDWWFKALLVNNRIMNPELLMDIVANASKYQSLSLSPQRREQFRNLLSTLIVQMDRFPNLNWPESVNPWPLVLNDGNWIESAAQVSLSRNVLRAHREDLTEAQLRVKSDSVFNIQVELAKDHSLNWSDLGLKSLKFGVPFYTYLDLVSTRSISPEAGVALMEDLTLSPEQLQSQLNQFLRTHFLASVKNANRIYKERVFDLQVSGEELYFAAVRESTAVRAAWSELKDRMVLIREYAMNVATSNNFSDEELHKVRSQFEGVDQSIRMTVLYPHLMALFYKLSQEQYTIKTRRGTIDAGDFMVVLYNGDFEPILPYVDEVIALKPIELLYSFDLGVRTGVFRDLGLDMDDFISTTISRFSEFSIKDLQGSMDGLEKKLRKNQLYGTFMAMCDEVKNGGTTPRTVFWSDVEVSPYLGIVKTNLFENFGVGAFSTSGQVFNYNYLDANYSEMSERIRVDVSAVIRLGESMILSYKSQPGASAPKSEAALKKIRDIRSQFVAQAKVLWNELGSCYMKLATKDRDVTSEVFRYEKEYLKQLAKDITRLRESSRETGVYEEITQKYNNRVLYANYQSMDEITPRGYRFGRPDVFMRIIRYMTEGLKTDSVNLPPIAPHIRYSFGGVDLTPVSDGLQRIRFSEFIPLTTEEEFIDSALRLYINGAHQFTATNATAWLRPFTYQEWFMWERRAMAMVSIYRALRGTEAQFISPEMVIDDHEEFLNLSHFNDSELSLMKAAKVSRKAHPVVFKWAMILYRQNLETIVDRFGLFDLPLKYASEGELGNVYYANRTSSDPDTAGDQKRATPYAFPIKRQGAFALAEDYYIIRSQATRQNLWVGLNQNLDQYLDQQVLSFYKREIETYTDLRKVISKRAKEDAALPPERRQYFVISLNDVVRGPYIRESLDLERSERVKDFSYKTGFCFAKDLDCAEFKTAK